ncbi:MAG: hypothetical protein LBF97_03325 [Elusimicrobiota bacterium]|jgi:hypothetical protein|nr:hypothetical protein [Elusimicrobiota bacterium]
MEGKELIAQRGFLDDRETINIYEDIEVLRARNKRYERNKKILKRLEINFWEDLFDEHHGIVKEDKFLKAEIKRREKKEKIKRIILEGLYRANIGKVESEEDILERNAELEEFKNLIAKGII